MNPFYVAAIVLLLATAAPAPDDRCLTCHGQGRPKGLSKAVVVDTSVLKGSIHASLPCTECHTVDPAKNHKGTKVVFCGQCHAAEAEGYNQSPHVAGRKANIERIPTCVTCHGGHDVLAIANPNAHTNHKNSVKICVACHEDQNLTEQVANLPKPTVIKAYENSIHGRALMVDGKAGAPACVDCHGSHSFLPADQPGSPIYKTHIASTCAKCHGDIAKLYSESVHGVALDKGVLDSPTCTNCHGEHDIKAHLDPTSRVFTTSVSRTCSDCHASEKIVAKYGLKSDRIGTFKESFHGAAGELGDKRVANCASCHGVHNIYPQTDPRSMINTANVETTCGQCHQDLPADFAKGTVHSSATEPSSGGQFYVRKFYIWFISILILGFITYRVLEYRRRIKRVA